ncbi:23S rRNA (guanine(745)-N(1))-methyltransferase [compost metagenome]
MSDKGEEAVNGLQIWACPVCGAELKQQERSYSCPNRHTYDLSAKGYINLLLVNQRKSKEPGDNKMMLAARRNVLAAGHFRALADVLSLQALQLAEELAGRQADKLTVLDAGCGEGYYLECINTRIRESGMEARLYGTDISKDAVAMAAGNGAGIHYAVASSKKLPVRPESVDCLLQIFAPHSDSEFSRVLRGGGKLVTVTPGKHHLYGLKELLYPKPYLNDEAEHPYPSFNILEKQRIRSELVLTDPSAIRDLVMMTPYYWRTEPAMLEKLMKRSELRTPLEFIVTQYGKR